MIPRLLLKNNATLAAIGRASFEARYAMMCAELCGLRYIKQPVYCIPHNTANLIR